MTQSIGKSLPRVLVLAVVAAVGVPRIVEATEVVMKDGRVLSGGVAPCSGLAETPQAGDEGALNLIICLDDHLRRTFVSKRQIVQYRDGSAGPVEKFLIKQIVKSHGPTVNSVGPIIRVQPFDEFGRRIFSMQTARGPADIEQGITELTPHWAKVEGMSHVWDMREAPSSIPTDVLAKILDKQPDAGTVEHQKKVARFYVQMERYEDAYKVLQKLLDDHPGDAQVKEAIEPSLRQLRQLSSQRLLDELKRRRDAGQHALARDKLKIFPSEGVAGEILQEVRELTEQYQTLDAQREEVIQKFNALLNEVSDTSLRARIEPIGKEIAEELNLNTLGRMAAFRLAMDDAKMTAGERLSLAISGWLLGSDAASANLPTSLSTHHVRGLIREYLCEPVQLNREDLFKKFGSEESAAPRTIALLLANMKPPLATPPVEGKPGYYELEVQGLDKEPPVRYLVQLPPEYDPHRHYPTVLTLRGAGTTAEQQIAWWAGDWAKGGRNGQAARQGYIVVAPDWAADHQKGYQYSARELAAILNPLRDACRRFSIDTDRVFLSGHSMGGDAAWDVGLAHPDLWAGVIPIVARSDRYCSHYWKNAENLPFYVVGGEKDGRWLVDNAGDLDRYLTVGYNTTVVEYQGRGHEHYYDEIQHLFTWMKIFKRDFYPRKFICKSMRPWDNFFWWVELADMPEGAMVAPDAWPPPRGTIPMQTEASLTATNGVNVRTGASRATVWLAPEIVNFDQRVTVVVNGRRINGKEPFIKPDLHVLLEDARTRADRQHPFWARVDTATGR
ncbi:MAG: alpha/beta hydrolase-fold protein [Planctomycetia bacterium]|nr:alpha/beta hydrolase-fold protein [Planctomycetia bacterium]